MGAEFLDGGMSSTSSDLDTQVAAPNFDSTPAMSASWELELALIDVDYDFYYENTISPQAFDDFDFTEFAKMPDSPFTTLGLTRPIPKVTRESTPPLKLLILDAHLCSTNLIPSSPSDTAKFSDMPAPSDKQFVPSLSVHLNQVPTDHFLSPALSIPLRDLSKILTSPPRRQSHRCELALPSFPFHIPISYWTSPPQTSSIHMHLARLQANIQASLRA
jgi:hypothetical protein